MGEVLPAAAKSRPDWPIHLDHCFARILLDAACGRPWREVVAPPAWRNLDAEHLQAAVTLARAVLADEIDLAALNRSSLRRRGKRA